MWYVLRISLSDDSLATTSPRGFTLCRNFHFVRKKTAYYRLQAEGDPNFVTSLEAAAPARRGKKRGRYQGNPAEEGGSSLSSSLRSRWAISGDQQEEDLNHGAPGVDRAEAREERPWGQKSNKKSRRREWGSSSDSPLADQVNEPPAMSSWESPSGTREDKAGLVGQDLGCGGGAARGMFSGGSNGSGSSGGSRAQAARGVEARGAGASPSSSRWSRFLR